MARKFIAAVSVALAVTVVAPALAQKSADTLRVGFYDPISVVDIAFDPKGETAFTARAVYDTLISFNEQTGEFEPLLATSWKRIDPKTLEFTLRKDVTFHDGSPFDADDVVYSINWLADPKVKFRIKSRFLWIKKAEKVDRYTVRVISKRPAAVALARMAISVPIMPSDAHGAIKNKIEFGKKPIGTGPYRVTLVDPNKGIRFVRNDNYKHGNKAHPPGTIKNVHILPIPDVQTQVAQMITGNLDMMHNVLKDQSEALARDPRLAMTVSNSLLFRYIYFDSIGRSGNQALTDVRVRRALMHAIDRDAIRENIFSGGSTAVSMDAMCLKIQIGCVVGSKPPGYDPAKAKKLLAEAGHAKGLKLQITTLATSRRVAEAIAGYMRAVGVNASLKSVTFGGYRKLQRSGKLQSLVHQWSSGGVPDVDATISFYFGSKARDYWGDKQIAQYRKQGGSTFDVAKREAVYRKAFDRINEQGYMMPIASLPAVFVHAKDVRVEKGSISPFGAAINRIHWK